jgi:hypothetical protein
MHPRNDRFETRKVVFRALDDEKKLMGWYLKGDGI